MNSQKILKLSVSNLMRVSAVEIEPNGNLVVLSGDNGQGKSSVLNAIWFALGGTRNICEEPIKRGKQRAETVVELTDLIVTRVWTASGGTSLKVTNKDGKQLKTPQELLDGLLGSLSFDPLEFSRLAGSKRNEDRRQSVSILKNLLQLDFSELDSKRDAAFQNRTNTNRDLETVRSQLSITPHHADAPEAEISTADIAKEVRKAQDFNSDIDAIAAKAGESDTYARQLNRDIEMLDDQIASLNRRRADAVEKRDSAVAVTSQLHLKVKSFTRADVEGLLVKLQGADAINARVRLNAKRKELSKRQQDLIKKANEFSEQIADIDQIKSDKFSNAKYPVKEISFDEEGVKLAGLPFGQASTAEQIRASVAMGMALNPTLKVILVRDGADHLDQKSLSLVRTMAEEKEYQVWMERVVNDANTSFVIEDGHVKDEQVGDVIAQQQYGVLSINSLPK
jgi:DNA repair exonuclease SbcCD ATPase subunit